MKNGLISRDELQMLHLLEDKWQINREVPIQPWNSDLFEKARIRVSVYREDLNHPFIQGNKWHKLKAFILKALNEKKVGFISIGGAYSNHLQAVAWVAQQMKKKSLFWIRGGESEWNQNKAIENLRNLGAELHPLSRTDFRRFYSEPDFQAEPLTNYSDFQWVPMGGSSPECVPFVAQWAQIIHKRADFDFFVLPVATAGTVAGFSVGLKKEQTILAVEVLRSEGSLRGTMNQLVEESGIKSVAKVEWISGYDFGGYARKTEKLLNWCTFLHEQNTLPSEPVYSGKAFWSVSDLAQKGYFPEGSRILVLHTGGLFPWTIQSNPGF